MKDNIIGLFFNFLTGNIPQKIPLMRYYIDPILDLYKYIRERAILSMQVCNKQQFIP